MMKEKGNPAIQGGTSKEGSHKNIWYGVRRQRIEIPKTILKSKVLSNSLLKHLNNLSSQFYYTFSRFSNLFKQKTGYAPIDFFVQIKIQ